MGKCRKVHPANGLHLNLFPPESDWKPPEVYPNLSDAKLIAIDTETYDPNLGRNGPGGVRGDGEIAGISVATDTGFSAYYPIGHLDGGNLDRDTTFRWLKKTLSNPSQIKIGANIIYDLEWLAASGVQVQGTIHDVQIMEGLLDEEGSYSLEALSRKYLKIPKHEKLLREAAFAFGVDPKKDLWKLHSKYVGPYGEGDAVNTLKVYGKQMPLIEAEGLNRVFELESALTPVILAMRMQGVRVDLDKAEALNKRLKSEYEERLNRLATRFGMGSINVWSSDDLITICDIAKIKYPVTAKGNPSFVRDWLGAQSDPALKEVTALRTLDRLRGTFIQQKIIDCAINGRIHSQFHQMRGDEDGTRTGRFSSSNPNLQQVPSRDAMASLIRALFIPEPGQMWAKLDYSQQEPRIAVHFACALLLHGSDAAKQNYIDGGDIYEFITNAAGITRRQAKDLTLGRMYGMGIDKMADKLHCDKSEASEILSAFDESAPFLKKLAYAVEKVAANRGYIETIGGRHRHFSLWIPAGDRTSVPLHKNDALVRWGSDANLVRANCHKALNSLIQGSAADMTKRAMLNIFNKYGKIPLMQVHDEINYSVESEEEAMVYKKECEEAFILNVPVVCDLDYGRSWK